MREADLKRAAGADTSNSAVEPDFVCLKAEVDKVDADKLKAAPADKK